MTLDLEANEAEVEVKVLTSLASVTGSTGQGDIRIIITLMTRLRFLLRLLLL